MDLHISRGDPTCNGYPEDVQNQEIIPHFEATELTCSPSSKIYEYSFGAIMNRDRDEAYLEIEWGELKPYMGWNPVTNTFAIAAT